MEKHNLDGRVVIVGGGITGLAAARTLRQHAPGLALTLVEGDNRLGGKISTTRADGFIIEGGPDCFLSYKPRGLGLCRELGLEGRLHGTSGKVRRTYIMRAGRLYQLPEGLTGLIPSRFGPMLKTPLISPLGKLRMGLDYFVPPRTAQEDESLGAFVSRRLGHEVYERMIEPLMSGIYAGDGDQLSLNATFPNLRKAEVEHGGLIKSMLKAKRNPPRSAPSTSTKKWPAFLTLENGLAEIVEAAVSELRQDVEFRLATRVTGVTPNHQCGYQIDMMGEEPLLADAVILATPAFATAEIVDAIDAQAADALRQIPYASTATVSVVYPLAQVPVALDAHGYIVPRSEGHPVLACTWTSTKFPHRAPDGFALIRAFLGRAGQGDVLVRSDDQLVQLVRDELKAVLGITAAPHMQFVFRWPQAMPQYTLGHLDRVNLIEQRLKEHAGLFCAGAAYHGIGIPDCIASGEQAAAQALKFLQTQLSDKVMTA
ncbi:MAG TPA: protoporphyrinogen oxidase [Anaerolineae bacterium]